MTAHDPLAVAPLNVPDQVTPSRSSTRSRGFGVRSPQWLSCARPRVEAGVQARSAECFLRVAPAAAWISAVRKYRFALRVCPLRRLPALSSCPGHIPAQLHRWAALGNRVNAAGLHHNADRADPVNPRNRVQGGQHRSERGDPPIDFRGQPIQGLVEIIDLGEELLQQEGVHRAKAPDQRPLQRRQFLPQLPAREIRQNLRVRRPSDQRLHHRPPAHPHPSVSTLVTFTPASSSTFCNRLTSRLRSRVCCTR